MLLRLKFITMIGFVFAAVCLITLTNATLAHDGDDVSARSSHWYAEPFERPGLLGKPYIDVRYTHIKEDQSEFPLELDEPLRGMILSGNAPLTPLDVLPGPFHYDLYAEFALSTVGGSGNLGPDFDNLTGTLNLDLKTIGIGLTSFFEVFERVRPYIQLGYIYKHADASLTVSTVNANYSASNSDLLLNVGSEFDVMPWLAARIELDCNSLTLYNGPSANLEMICWPLDHVYLRGGIVAPVNGGGVGCLIGGGVAF